MKKLLSKRLRKKAPVSSRITNETVAEHRERILAGGRRFKYPMQYARHRLVLITTLLAVVTFVILAVGGWWQLYVVQNTNTLLYRATQITQVPVASVDGQSVRYSDYLMYYNSSIHFLQKSGDLDVTDENDKGQITFQKRQSLDIAIRNAYASKLAKERNITVTDEELERVNLERLTMANGPISQETYNASTLSLLGWTPAEEQRSTKNQLLKNNVSYAIDDAARRTAEKAARLVQPAGSDFEKIAAELGGEGKAKVTFALSGLVPLDNNDGGLADAASKLEKGQASPILRSSSGDGYYFVRLLEKTDSQLNYAYIKIPLTEFDKRLASLRQAGKIREYIKLPDVKTEQ